MSKTRFTPWVVLACIGTLAGCTSGEGDTAGNTELNVMIPNNAGQSSAPGAFDIQVVEYTIACNDGSNAALDPVIEGVEPTFDDDVTISGVLEVLDAADPARPNPGGDLDFGPDLGEVYVFQGFMDLPPTADCTAQFRARDFDGEVICTSTELFDIEEDDTTTLNILMYCGISFQAPVGMLDTYADFQFNVANFCPDLFVLNCIDSELNVRNIGGSDVLATACQVRFRDGDSQCGNSCDPQTCVPDAEGLSCASAPEPLRCIGGDNPDAVCATHRCNGGNADVDGQPCRDDIQCRGTSPIADGTCDAVATAECQGFGGTPDGTCVGGPRTEVTCTSTSGYCAISCNGVDAAASCVFQGDTLGVIGGPAPGPGQPGPGGFFVSCATYDNDGDPETPEVPLAPGDAITCVALTMDGDDDCIKRKDVRLTTEGLSACQTFGGDAACSDRNLNPLASVCNTDFCNDATCDGSTSGACCRKDPTGDAEDGTSCDAENPPTAECQSGVCVATFCTADSQCDDGNPCTQTLFCDEPDGGPTGSGNCCLTGNTTGCPAAQTPAPLAAGTDCSTASITDGVCGTECDGGTNDGVSCGTQDPDCPGGTCDVPDGICRAVVCETPVPCADRSICTTDGCAFPPVEGQCQNTGVPNIGCQGGTNDGETCTTIDDCPDQGANTFCNETGNPCSTCVDGTAAGDECFDADDVTDCENGGGTCEVSLCEDGACAGQAPDPEPIQALIPTVCRNSFTQEISNIPTDVIVDPTPIEASTAFSADIEPTLFFTQEFLQGALIALFPSALTQADVTATQAAIATTGVASEPVINTTSLTPLPQTVFISTVPNPGDPGGSACSTDADCPLVDFGQTCGVGTPGQCDCACSAGCTPASCAAIVTADLPVPLDPIVAAGFTAGASGQVCFDMNGVIPANTSAANPIGATDTGSRILAFAVLPVALDCGPGSVAETTPDASLIIPNTDADRICFDIN